MSLKIKENILSKAVFAYTTEYLNQLKNTPDFKTSIDFEKKMKKLFEKGIKKKKRSITLKTIIIIAAIVSIMTSIICVDAVRKGIIEFFTETFGTYDTVRHETVEENNYIEATEAITIYEDIIKDKYSLKIPDNYELIDETVMTESSFALYMSNNEQLIFEQFTNKYYKENINKENIKRKEKTVNGETYYISYIKKSNETKVIWEKYGYVFSICCGLDENEIIKLSESLKKEN